MPRLADKSPGAIPVDVELVIAVDVSFSMDPEEQALQREGYVQALTSREFLQALREGAHGKVAITYFEWAGEFDQKIIMPWRLIEGPESADSVAAEIAAAPYRRASRTSISGGLKFAKPLFDHSGYRGLRRVIDVSGDGANNSGRAGRADARRRARRRHHHQRAADHAQAARCAAPWISKISTSTTKTA